MDEPIKWHVEAKQIHQTTTLADNGPGITTVWVIPYTLDSGPGKGTTHQVTVPGRDFTEEGVRQAITEAANSVHRVGSLSG